jgi:hypothetical protein
MLPVVAEREYGDGEYALLGLEGTDPQKRGDGGVESARGVEGPENEAEVEHVDAADVEGAVDDGVERGEDPSGRKCREMPLALGVDQRIDGGEAAERRKDGDYPHRRIAHAHQAGEGRGDIEVDGRVQVWREVHVGRGVERKATGDMANGDKDAVFDPVVLIWVVQAPERSDQEEQHHSHGDDGEQPTKHGEDSLWDDERFRKRAGSLL